MLRIGAPIEVERVFEVDGEPYRVTFRVRPPSRALLEEMGQAEDLAGYWTPERLAEWLLGWEGVANEDGEPIEVSAETLAAVRDAMPTLYAAAVEAVFAAVPIKKERDRKNSESLPGGTTAAAPSTAAPAN